MADTTLAALLRASTARIAPRCQHFGECGGCTLQHVPYPEQLRLKAELVTRLVRRAVPGAPAALPTIPGTTLEDPWGYRHKVHFVFGSPRNALVMGHYAAGSRRVVPVRECPVHDEKGNRLAFALRDAYARAHATAAPEGTLKSIAVRVGYATREVMGTLVVTDPSDARVRASTRRVLDSPQAPSSFHVNIHPRGDAFVFGRETRRIAGPDRMREEVAGISYLISPTAFFQTNVRAAEILVGLVREAVPAGTRVLDLYAGAGLFGLPLARDGHDVVAVEENRAAVADGEASRDFNSIPSEKCRFVARRVEDALRHDTQFDTVILDPPREGCSAAVIETVFGTMAPAAAVYVSCNPEALARDLATITRHRYRIESIQPLDMFPHTAHVETVVCLSRLSQGATKTRRRTE